MRRLVVRSFLNVVYIEASFEDECMLMQFYLDTANKLFTDRIISIGTLYARSNLLC